MSDLERPELPTIEEALLWPIIADNSKKPTPYIAQVRSSGVNKQEWMEGNGSLVEGGHAVTLRSLSEKEQLLYHGISAGLYGFASGKMALVVWRR